MGSCVLWGEAGNGADRRHDRLRPDGRSQRLYPDAAQAADIGGTLGLAKQTLAVTNTRKVGKRDLILNSDTPQIEVHPETYEVRANDELLPCAPADVLPMAQRYFLC